jgi:hypothetical protein
VLRKPPQGNDLNLKSIITDDIPVVALGAGVAPTSLHFNLVGIAASKAQDILLTYDDNFYTNPLINYSNQFTNVLGVAPLSWTPNRLSAASSSGVQESIYQTHICPLGPSFLVKLHVAQLDSNAMVHVGLCKDTNNWVFISHGSLAYGTQIIWNVGGSFGYSQVSATIYTAPFDIIFTLNNGIVSAFIDDGNGLHYLGDKFMGGTVDLTQVSNLQSWQASWGYRGTATAADVTISSMQVGYPAGVSTGADVRPVTYEDGCPIMKDGCIYLTVTDHSTSEIVGCGGINIYKMNINNQNLQFVGKIFTQVGTAVQAHGSGKLLYDRCSNQWVFLSTNFSGSPQQLYIGTAKGNLLEGIHIITSSLASIPDSAYSVWDIDLIYNYTSQVYQMVYTTSNGSATRIVQATTATGTYTTVVTAGAWEGEGNGWFKANGQYYITCVVSPAEFRVLSPVDLSVVGVIVTSVWPNGSSAAGPNDWGSIIPICDGGITKFIMLIFANNHFGVMTYGYGPIWIYQAQEVENGYEYKTNDVLFLS